jgi:hypothetical protein
MSGTISAAQFQALSTDFTILGGADIEQNPNFNVGSKLYADLVADLSVQTVIGFAPNGDPIYDDGIAPGVDPAVYDWLNGAEYANQDIGFFGQFIVDQTQEEYNIRVETHNIHHTTAATR